MAKSRTRSNSAVADPAQTHHRQSANRLQHNLLVIPYARFKKFAGRISGSRRIRFRHCKTPFGKGQDGKAGKRTRLSNTAFRRPTAKFTGTTKSWIGPRQDGYPAIDCGRFRCAQTERTKAARARPSSKTSRCFQRFAHQRRVLNRDHAAATLRAARRRTPGRGFRPAPAFRVRRRVRNPGATGPPAPGSRRRGR